MTYTCQACFDGNHPGCELERLDPNQGLYDSAALAQGITSGVCECGDEFHYAPEGAAT